MNDVVDSLLPHQRRLVEEYRKGSPPSFVVLDAPTGTGKSRALAVIAAQRAENGTQVVVVVPRALVSQWSSQLSLIGVPAAAVYLLPADFRMAFDIARIPWPPTGVVLCASSVVRTPLLALTVPSVSPSLLIVDDVVASAGSELGRSLRSLADRSRQVIVTSGGGQNRWYPAGEMRRWTYPLVDNAGDRIGPRFSSRVHAFEADPAEAVLVRQALELLGRIGYPFLKTLLTRSAIQSALLGVARRLDAPEQLPLWEEGPTELGFDEGWLNQVDRGVVDSVWGILDDFDELSPDRRLAATWEEVQSGVQQRRPVVVICDRVREVDYIFAALDSMEVPMAAISGQTPRDDRDAAMASFIHGGVLVVTSTVFTTLPPLPDGTKSIWFAPPLGRTQARQRLGLGVASNGVEILLLKAVPPATPADDLVDQMVKILEDPWSEPPGMFPDNA